MTELQHASGIAELYERLIDRVGLALETASTAVRLRNELPVELELDGLSNAEIELIEAWLEKDPEKRATRSGGAVEDDSKGGSKVLSQDSRRVIWLSDRRQAGPRGRTQPYSKTTFRF